MEKILITGSSYTVSEQVGRIKEECGELRHVSVFFENYNFIIKNYRPMSRGVHLILEFEKKEVQIESANCGYGGGGPGASVELLAMLGLDKDHVEELFYCNDAIDFDVKNGAIYNLDTSQLFFSSVRKKGRDKSLKNKIEHNKNVSADLEMMKVTIYNPQRTCWNGFLNLLSYMENIQMEYYIGPNSPLEGGLYIGKGFDREFQWGPDKPDIKGTEHVNLCLVGSNFSVVCLIDRKYEVQVIESTYLSLTGGRLFENGRYHLQLDKKNVLKELLKMFRNKNPEVHDIVTITGEQAGKRQR